MLLASTLNVESALRVRILEIREREFQFFMDNVRSVGRLTTVLAGFGHAGLVYTKFIDHNLCGEGELLCAELTYPLATALALGCAILTMWGSVLLATMAPGAALHGHHDNYSEIVDLLEREFKIVLQLGAASVAAFGLVAILFFWAKWGQALHHSDPVRMGTPLTPGGIGGQQHHWASSFAHGEHINAVRNLPTALFLTCVILTFLYIMYLVQLYLSSKVFHIPKQHLVRGVWGGRGHARPAEFMSRARRLSDEPGAVGTTHRSAPRHTTAHCTARGGPPQQLEQWRAQGHLNGGGAQGPGRYGDWHQAWAGWKPGRTDGYAKLDPSPEPALRPFRNDRWSINSLDKTSVMSDPPSFRSSSPPALGVPPSILHALSTGLASCLGGAAPGARLSEPAAAAHGRGGSVASRESRAE